MYTQKSRIKWERKEVGMPYALSWCIRKGLIYVKNPYSILPVQAAKEFLVGYISLGWRLGTEARFLSTKRLPSIPLIKRIPSSPSLHLILCSSTWIEVTGKGWKGDVLLIWVKIPQHINQRWSSTRQDPLLLVSDFQCLFSCHSVLNVAQSSSIARWPMTPPQN